MDVVIIHAILQKLSESGFKDFQDKIKVKIKSKLKYLLDTHIIKIKHGNQSKLIFAIT